MSLARSTASSSERVTTMTPFRSMDVRAGPSAGSRFSTCRATRAANRRSGVSTMDRASGSCSACAMRSAAIQRVSPRAATMTISVGPAWKSMGQSADTSAFAAATQALPGPTILSTRGTVAVP